MNASNSIQANIRLQQLEQQNFLLNTQLAQINEVNKGMIKDLKEAQHRKNGLTVGMKVNINNGGRNKHVITVERRVTLGQIVKQNHSRVTKITKGDQEVNNSNNNPRDFKGGAIIVEKLGT